MLTFLVAIDGSGYSDSAVDYVVRRAGLSKEPAHVHLLNVQLPLGGVNVKLFIKPESVEAYYRDEGMARTARWWRTSACSGRILGEVIREQEGRVAGPRAFELIERVRQLSVAYRLKSDAQAGKRARPAAEEPERRPDRQRDPRLQLLLAPGQHRRRPPPRAPREVTSAGDLQEGSLAADLRAPGRRRHPRRRHRGTLRRRYISPVLTAHPTEVQRKSILDAERAIAELIGARDGLHTRARARDNEALLRARVTQLWQTRMLRTPSSPCR
jgi:phosphoenolpyruvate carboxylase